MHAAAYDRGPMKAYTIHQHGDPQSLQVEDRPTTRPGPGEVTVALEVAALNHLDLWVRRGVPGHRFPLPLIPGSDGAGRVIEIGPDTVGPTPQERVLVSPGYGCGARDRCLEGNESLCRKYLILGESRDGTCAQQITVPASALLPLPEGLEPQEAAALPLVLMTTWRMLIVRAKLSPGETVFVQAGGSGVGSTAIQIARAWGCRVITTVGSARKATLARELGADEVILYKEQDVTEAIRELTAKRGVDVVVEHTGAETWNDSLRALTPGGRLVTCGATTGAEAPVDLRVLFFKQIELLGSTMGSRADLGRALRLVERGLVRPLVDKVFAFDQLPAAHQYLEERRAFGKVVIDIPRS